MKRILWLNAFRSNKGTQDKTSLRIPIIIASTALIISIALMAIYLSSLNVTEVNRVRDYQSLTSSGSPPLGSYNASVTIVEFGEYQCPSCKFFFDFTKPKIVQDYVNAGKVKLIFKDFAYYGPDSILAAQAAYCAGDQGRYWQYHDYLYSHQGGINSAWASPKNLLDFASKLKLDTATFDTCLSSGVYRQRVEQNTAEARNLGVNGTPWFFIIDSEGKMQQIEGAQPYSVFQQTIDSMLPK